FSFSVPTGRCDSSSRSLKAALISSSAGRRRSSRRAPALVGVTLRVVRLSRRRPTSLSRRRMQSLKEEAEIPRFCAAARKPPASITAANSATSLRLGWRILTSPVAAKTVRLLVQPVHCCPDYHGLSAGRYCPRRPFGHFLSSGGSSHVEQNEHPSVGQSSPGAAIDETRQGSFRQRCAGGRDDRRSRQPRGAEAGLERQ